jgi:hypothetical protein
VFYSSKKKIVQPEVPNSVELKMQQEQLKRMLGSMEKVLNSGLSVIKRYSLFQERYHFTALENFILLTYKWNRSLDKPVSPEKNKVAVSSELHLLPPEPKTPKKVAKTGNKDRRSHRSLAESLKKKEKELCVLNNSSTEDSDKKILGKSAEALHKNKAVEEEVSVEEL